MTSISLVIPVRDEAATLPALLASIAAQTHKPDEVLFVDGGSDDHTVAMLHRAIESDRSIRVIEAGDATPGKARNIGIAAARNDWVALTDAGIRLEPAWLELLAKVAGDDESVDVVYGNYEPDVNSFFEHCAALCYVAPKQRRPGGAMRGPSVASALIRRSMWSAVGGFPDLRAVEDIVFKERVEDIGATIGWAPRATVWWQLEPSLGNTFRKFVLYSRHNVWAGRQRGWHYGVAKNYLLALPFILLSLMHSPWWMMGPLLGVFARVSRSIWIRRDNRSLLWVINPFRFIGVAVILITLDAATFLGWAQAILRKPINSLPIPTVSQEEKSR